MEVLDASQLHRCDSAAQRVVCLMHLWLVLLHRNVNISQVILQEKENFYLNIAPFVHPCDIHSLLLMPSCHRAFPPFTHHPTMRSSTCSQNHREQHPVCVWEREREKKLWESGRRLCERGRKWKSDERERTRSRKRNSLSLSLCVCVCVYLARDENAIVAGDVEEDVVAT